MLRDDPGLFLVRDDAFRNVHNSSLSLQPPCSDALRRAPLERALQVAIVVTVFGAMLASGAILDWLAAGRKLRWAGLALVALAVAYARSRGVRARPLVPYALAAAFAVLAVLSVTWSADPRSSVGRGGAFALLLAAAALIASAGGGTTGARRRSPGGDRTRRARRGGRPDRRSSRAIAEATPREPARYQGFGGNPNSATLLLAFGVPLAAAWLARTRLPRFLAAAAAGAPRRVDRGVGLPRCDPRSVLRPRRHAGDRRRGPPPEDRRGRRGDRRRRPRAGGERAAAARSARPGPDTCPPPGPRRPGGGYFNAEAYLPLEDELGHPPFGVAAPDERSTLLGSSGACAGLGLVGAARARATAPGLRVRRGGRGVHRPPGRIPGGHARERLPRRPAPARGRGAGALRVGGGDRAPARDAAASRVGRRREQPARSRAVSRSPSCSRTRTPPAALPRWCCGSARSRSSGLTADARA